MVPRVDRVESRVALVLRHRLLSARNRFHFCTQGYVALNFGMLHGVSTAGCRSGYCLQAVSFNKGYPLFNSSRSILTSVFSRLIFASSISVSLSGRCACRSCPVYQPAPLLPSAPGPKAATIIVATPCFWYSSFHLTCLYVRLGAEIVQCFPDRHHC